MESAIKAVRDKKMGYLKAAKESAVPRATLYRLVNSEEQDVKKAASTTLGRKPVFSKQLEQELVSYLVEMEALFFGLTIKYVCIMAYQLAARNNIAHPFGADGRAGKDWFYSFMGMHKDKLSLRKPTGTSFSRPKGFNKKEVGKCLIFWKIFMKNTNIQLTVYIMLMKLVCQLFRAKFLVSLLQRRKGKSVPLQLLREALWLLS